MGFEQLATCPLDRLTLWLRGSLGSSRRGAESRLNSSSFRVDRLESPGCAPAAPKTIYPPRIPVRRSRRLAPFRLNTWEEKTLRAELDDSDVVGWVRNLDRKSWALLVPYEEGGELKALFPDFVFVRRVGEHLVVDILDPHDPNLGDAPAKAHGLAKFAQLHGPAFGRIEVVAEIGGALRRLDLKDEDVRRRVFAASTPAHLRATFT